MSYILDALKKSEHERRLEQDGKGLSVSQFSTQHDASPKKPVWLISSIVLACTAISLAAYYYLTLPQTPPFSSSDHTTTETPAIDNNKIISIPQPARQTPPATTPATASEGEITSLEEPHMDILEVQALDEQRAKRLPEKPSASSTAVKNGQKGQVIFSDTVLEVESPAISDKPSVIFSQTELDLSPNLPATFDPQPPQSPPSLATAPVPPRPIAPPSGEAAQLKLDVLVYSDTVARRFVFIDGQKYRQGDAIDDGLIVNEIRPESVLLEHDGILVELTLQ